MLILIRHGQAEWQLKRDCNLNSSLTELGQAQAVSLGQFIQKGEHPLAVTIRDTPIVHTSPLLRAKQTADALAKANGFELSVIDELAEAPFDLTESLPRQARMVDCETYNLVCQQYTAFCDGLSVALMHLLASHKGKPIVAITHGGVIKTILRLLLNRHSVNFTIKNASITALSWESGIWQIHDISWSEHLSQKMKSV
ncbi:histidine phosphatase family protein [Erythrobacter donghaensis]|uniref:histidine phosphatase family protein n=1 Tax=Erythrobacter donghaensis TaxID=267135 RepID=UPI0018C5DBF0|nr:histidine phosphatase family protein [Erythrobacter donghaensis]